MRLVFITDADTDPMTVELPTDCTEILTGIPPYLEGIIDPDTLPIVYEEPDPPVSPGTTLDQIAADVESSPDIPDAVKTALAALLAAVGAS